MNRQIKADNALLREMKALVKKLMDAVRNTIPAIAEAMETVRQKMIIFRYQLLHISSGKKQLGHTLNAVRPELYRYVKFTNRLRAAVKERRGLLDEKKATPALRLLRHQELAAQIAALTENIEEMKSEKAILLNQFDCPDEAGMSAVRQSEASMEASLRKLDQQEEKYVGELDAALAQYAKLQAQAADMDNVELEAARRVIRSDKEREAVKQLQAVYGQRYDSSTMARSRKDVAAMLGEAVESVSVRQKLQQTAERQNRQHTTREQGRER